MKRTSILKTLRHRVRNDNGVISISYAFMAPVFLVMCLLIVQVGLAVRQDQVVQAAAESAAQKAAAYDASENDGVAVAEEILSQLGATDTVIEVSRGDIAVTVRIEASVPNMIGIPMSVSAQVEAPVEEFKPLEERS